MREFRIEEAARKAAEFHGRDGKGFDNAERRNVYQCDADASHLIVTVDREPGVTSFTIQCPICEAAGILSERGFYRHPAMTSSMYVAHPSLRPTFEWYRPDSLAGLTGPSADHVLKGGLLLRKVEKPDG